MLAGQIVDCRDVTPDAGAYRLSDLRRLLAQPTTQLALSFMDNHPLIRDMREYTAFLEMLYPEHEPIKEATR
jgi:hypothetical protein